MPNAASSLLEIPGRISVARDWRELNPPVLALPAVELVSRPLELGASGRRVLRETALWVIAMASELIGKQEATVALNVE